MHRRQKEDSGDFTVLGESSEMTPSLSKRSQSRSKQSADCSANDSLLAWLFPGLGSRHVGMGADIIGVHSAADDLIAVAGDILGYDPVAICLEGRSRVALPTRQEAEIIYVINCAYAQVLFAEGPRPNYVCGHSLGTWSAAYACGVFDFATGLRTVIRVEELMEQHVDGKHQAMGVVIGLSESCVSELCEETENVFLANYNSDGQYVIAGLDGEVERVLSSARELGARTAQRLNSPRAMHSPLIAAIDDKFADYIDTLPISDSEIPLVSCLDGMLLAEADQFRAYFRHFLFRPVFWEQTIRELVNLEIQRFVDVGAGGVLAGMMPFIDRSVEATTASEALVESSMST